MEDEIRVALAKLGQVRLKERQQAIALCAEKPEHFGAKFFTEILLHQEDAICKWYAIRALGDLQASDYSELLIDILRAPDVEVGKSSLHRICARSIGLLGPQMVPHVIDLLDEPDAEIRLAAVDTLGEIGAPNAIPVLFRCLISGERNLQLWAALSLAKIGPDSIPALVDALSSVTKKEVLIILDALVIIDTPSVIDAIAKIARGHPDDVRFYFKGGWSKRAQRFLETLHQVISSGSPEKKQATTILSLLKLKNSNLRG